MHRTIPLILYLIFLAVPSTGDAAIRTVDYRVVIDGTADYNRADADEEPSAQHDETGRRAGPAGRRSASTEPTAAPSAARGRSG